MHEAVNIVKSRSTTPHQEYLRPGLAEALQLLQKWNLLELQHIFRDHDITLRSLVYLTENEICELIPKIGLRTIFRALLKEWRETNYNTESVHSRAPSCAFNDNDSFLDQIELKTECNSEDFDQSCSSCTKDNASSGYSNSLDMEPQNDPSPHDENNNETLNLATKRTNWPEPLKAGKSYNGERFIVLDILKRTSDGQTVLEFYRINQFLDIKNRKRVVNLLIRDVVERKIDKYTAIFHDMTRQLLELFPTEKYETYFVAHSGCQSARGALYYRYSNYTRQLRKEGLLAYKKHKPKNYAK